MVDNENDEKNYSQMAPNVNINDEDNGDNQKWASAIEGLRTDKHAKNMPNLQMELTINSQNQKHTKSVPQKNKGNQQGIF